MTRPMPPPAFDDAQIVYLDEHYSGQSSANVHWMIFNGVLVFLMQCGFRRPIVPKTNN